MEPVYLHQAYLPAPLPRTVEPFPEQPFSDTAIDRWLESNKEDAYTSDVLVPGFLRLRDVPSDQVLCTVLLVVSEYQEELYNEHIILYNLFLSADIPGSSGIKPASLSSPLATICRFEVGLDPVSVQPCWTRMRPRLPLTFRQPRGAIAEMFAALAFWKYNNNIRALSKDMIEWAIVAASGTPAESKHLLPGYYIPRGSAPAVDLGAQADQRDRKRSRELEDKEEESHAPRPRLV